MARKSPAQRVGLRELRQNLRAHMQRVRAGARLVITENGEPIALIEAVPPVETIDERLRRGIDDGDVEWGGKRLRSYRPNVRLPGASVASAVIEDRR